MDTFEPASDRIDVAEVNDIPEEVPDLPSDVRSDYELETELQITMAAEQLGALSEFSDDSWAALDAAQRLSALQTVENTMAEIQNRQPVEITAKPMESNVFGGFDPNTGGIAINAEHLTQGIPPAECLNTIVHEGRHAFQDQAMKDPALVADPAIAQEWAENDATYLNPALVGQEMYEAQPLEADAFGYADRVVNMMIAGQLGPVER